MKNKILLSVITIFVIFTGCVLSRGIKNSGEITTKDYDIKNFTDLNISNSINVNLKQDKSFSIRVKIDKAFVKHFNLELKNKTLYIHLDSNHTYSNPNIIVDINLPDIESITLNGASSLKINKFELDDIKFNINGASNIKGKLIANYIDINQSGATDLKLMGETDRLKINLSGAGDCHLEDLIANEVYFDISGADDLNVNVVNNIKGEASGASDLEIYGNPDKQIINNSGSADIIFE